ncbi:hypothetical protein Bca4012_094808 [Brassica carinata]
MSSINFYHGEFGHSSCRLEFRTPGEIGSLETSAVNVTLSSSTIQRLLQTGCSVVPDDYIRAELNRSPLLTDFLESFSALRRKLVTKANGCHPHLIAPKEGYHRLIESSIVFMGGPSEVTNAAFGKMWEESKKATLLVDRRE